MTKTQQTIIEFPPFYGHSSKTNIKVRDSALKILDVLKQEGGFESVSLYNGGGYSHFYGMGQVPPQQIKDTLVRILAELGDLQRQESFDFSEAPRALREKFEAFSFLSDIEVGPVTYNEATHADGLHIQFDIPRPSKPKGPALPSIQ